MTHIKQLLYLYFFLSTCAWIMLQPNLVQAQTQNQSSFDKLRAYSGNQDDLRGLYTGILYQEGDWRFYFEIQIETISKEGKVGGITYIESRKELGSMGENGNHGTMRFEGRLEEKEGQLYLNYQETFIEKQEIDTMKMYWCIKGGSLKILESKQKKNKQRNVYIQGPWTATRPTCKPGSIDVSRVLPKKDNETIVKYTKKFEAIGVVAEKKLEIQSDSLIIEVWDEMIVDGDTVSLFMNGDWILRNQRINKQKKIIKLYDLEEVTTIILHAENLGSQPPNTAAISLYDGITRQQIKLSSSKNKSEAVLIYRKK